MKKIVSIMGAALLASSIFAVDFSAGVRMEGSLFNYADSTKTISLFKESHNNQFYHAPIAFSISGDKAGGAYKITDKDAGNALTDAWSIWIKPVDVLKITVGRWSTNLNQEHIGWCNTESGIESDGYAFSFAKDAFSADLFLASGNGNYFFTVKNGGTPTIKEFFAKAQYSADFGTINGMFNAISNFKDYRFGVGYNAGKLLPVGLWVNAIGYYAGSEFQAVRGEADVTATFGSVGMETFIAGGYNLVARSTSFTGSESWHVGGATDKGAVVGFYSKFTMPVDALTLYLELKDDNLLASNFSMTIQPGFTTNLGACALNLGVKVSATKAFAVDVPVELKVSF